MKHFEARIATTLAVAMAAVTMASLPAQQANASAQENAAAAAGAKGSVGFGDQSASHAWEMSAISAELEGKLDSKTANVGDRVALKTIDKVQTSDGTFIPRGSHIVGHITAVQAYDRDHGGAMIAIAFDRVEMKGGQSEAIFTLIRGATAGTNASAMNTSPMGNADTTMGGPMGSGSRMGGGRNGGGMTGGYGGTGVGTGSISDARVDRSSDPLSPVAGEAGVPANPSAAGAVETAGHGEVDTNPGAHQAAAQRAIPRPTGIPGVMLSGNSTASGVFSSSRQNIHFDSGTQIQLGIVASE